MAINLNCNLNGGDTVTPNNELFYRIYGDVDAYASPIHTTGTGLADNNVTVTDDVVVITNVDETTNTSFKISAVDEAGNEGVLSDAKASTTYLFEDTFDGTVLNPDSKWIVSNPNTAQVSISQDNELIFTTTPPQSGYLEDSLETANAFTFADNPEMWVSFDCKTTATAVSDMGQYIEIKSNGSQDNSLLMFCSSSSTTAVTMRVYDAGVSASDTTEEMGSDWTTYKTFKVKISATHISVYLWGGSSWTTLLDNLANPFDTNITLELLGRQRTNGRVISYDNAYITNQDYLTQYPS